MRLRSLLLLGILLSLTLSLHAQQLRDAVTIEVVDVPVFVARNMTPVQGLTRDDFELYVNGERQAIDYFDVVSPATEPSLRERRLFLLVFDAAFSRPHALVRAQKAAAQLIASAPESDLFAIATFTLRDGVQFATSFSADREAVQRAVASLSTSQSGDPLAIVMTPAERASIQSVHDAAQERADAYLAAMPGADRVMVAFHREMQLDHIRRRAQIQIESFEELSVRLSSLEGQKHVVLLTEGFEGFYDAGAFIETTVPQPPPTLRPLSTFGDAFLHADLRKMYEAFQHSDVFLHALDLEGLAPFHVAGAHDLLSGGTGGVAILNGNNPTRSLARVSQQFAHGYRLGFTPRNPRRGHNSIKVKVRDARGLTVKYRLGFSGTPQSTDVDEGLYLADIILNDVPQTGTAAALEVRRDLLHARVPMSTLAAQLGTAGKAELLVYIFDAEGKAISYHRQVIDVPQNAVGESTFDIALPADAVVAKALLRVDASVGFTRVPIG